MSDVLSRPATFGHPQQLPSLRADRTNRGIAAVTLSLRLVGGSTPAITSPIPVKHHVSSLDFGIVRSPAAFTATPSEARTDAFLAALNEALELAEVMAAEDQGDPIDQQTLLYAADALLPFVRSLQMPCPVVLPLQNGGIGTEWHDFGMNIELRFRHAFDVYAVVEDARNILPAYHGRDPSLNEIAIALREFSRRSVG